MDRLTFLDNQKLHRSLAALTFLLGAGLLYLWVETGVGRHGLFGAVLIAFSCIRLYSIQKPQRGGAKLQRSILYCMLLSCISASLILFHYL